MEKVIITVEAWRAEGECLSRYHKSQQWAIADWIVAGMDNIPATEVYDATEKLFPQYTRTTLANMASVARAFPASLRSEALAFGHHKAAMAVDSQFRAEWLLRAAAGDGMRPWSVAKLAFEINGHGLEENYAAKEAEATAEEEATDTAKAEAPAPKPKRQKADAFTLSHLPASYRSKLEKLAMARRTTTTLLAVAILEAYLDQEIEEIHEVEERAAAARAQEKEVAAKVRAEARDKKAEALAEQHGGAAAEYRAAMDEFYPTWIRQYGKGKPVNFWPCSQDEYALWRVREMEDEAWAENAEWDAEAFKRALAQAEAEAQPETLEAVRA